MARTDVSDVDGTIDDSMSAIGRAGIDAMNMVNAPAGSVPFHDPETHSSIYFRAGESVEEFLVIEVEDRLTMCSESRLRRQNERVGKKDKSARTGRTGRTEYILEQPTTKVRWWDAVNEGSESQRENKGL